MGQKIERDQQRFRKIVRGKVKSNLSKYISRGEMIGKKGKDLVSIPLPQIDIPQFRYGQKGSGGVGQGEGEPGQPLTAPQGDGTGKAGDQPGGHILEVDLTMEELAEILGEELALPRIEPRGKKNIVTTKISSAYELCNQIVDARFPADQWNVYAFHFSDGDNWGDDSPRCVDLLNEKLLPKLNLFGYGQVESPYGSGEFFEYINELSNEK